MKKIVCCFFACLLVTAMLCGCGAAQQTDAEKIVGTWEGQKDMTVSYQAVTSVIYPNAYDLLEQEDVMGDALCTFNEDGTFEMHYAISEENCERMNLLYDERVKNALEEAFAAEGLEFSEAALQESGYASLREFSDSLLGDTGYKRILTNFENKKTGTYKVSDGQLILVTDGDEEGKEEAYPYTMTETGISIGETEGDPGTYYFLCPIELVKVENP